MLRLTEQGETIASKYADAHWGGRIWKPWSRATLEASLLHAHGPDAAVRRYAAVMDTLSTHACSAYRALVYETPGFVDYFRMTTPIAEIARTQHRQPPGRAPLGERAGSQASKSIGEKQSLLSERGLRSPG